MKNKLILFSLMLCGLAGWAQTGHNYSLILNRKVFHTNDTVSVSDFSTLGLEPLQVLDANTNQQYLPASYQWVVSVNDSSGIWKGTYSADPAAATHDGEARLHRTLQMAKTGDVIVIDNITYAHNTPASLPKGFSFLVR